VVVRGLLDGAPWSARLPLAGAVPQAGVGALWGRAKIDALLDAMRHGAPEDATRAEVVRVALEHRLVSRYTSLVAVDVTPTAPAGTVPLAGRVALPLPEGLVHDAILGVPQTATPMPALLAGGAAAVLAALGLFGILRRRDRGAASAPGC
jgi:Ca-activated chloride channel homolog